MNTIERNAFVKSTAVDSLSLSNATQIDDYSYAIPVEVDGERFFAKVVVTACDMRGSKTHDPFSIEDAVTDYAQKCADRKSVADAKAKAKASAKIKVNSTGAQMIKKLIESYKNNPDSRA